MVETGAHSLWDWLAAVSRRATWAFAAVSAGLAVLLIYVVAPQPLYTDVYYHLNAANRLVSGQGLTDAYLWNYVNAPASRSGDWSVPSHQYWMPMPTLMAAAGMALTGAPASYPAAQIPFAAALWGVALIGYAAGARLGRTAFMAWLAGLLTLLSPFYALGWGAVDSTTPFALFGAGCLLLLGALAASAPSDGRAGGWWLLAGALAALSHLSRPDGVLLLGVAALTVAIVAGRRRRWKTLGLALPLLAGYLLVMLPWLVRNLQAFGAFLPAGGLQGMFYTEYDDLFAYPAVASLQSFLAEMGVAGFITTRWAALFGSDGGLISGNFGTFLAVEGMIFLAPLMLIGLVRRWRNPFLWPFMLAALAVHLVMTLVFPFAGVRGGLLHSASALVPFWAALGLAGLGDVIGWVAKRRRTWQPGTATHVFGTGLLALAVMLLAMLAARGGRGPSTGERALYAALDAALPPGERVFSADPAAIYYFTGRGGAVLPNSPPGTLQQLAAHYETGYVLLQADGLPSGLESLWDSPPDLLTGVPIATEAGRLYAIER
ncbi:MAG: hypothetical protein JNL34_16555 [Anaerolineae bacterium]|nr:hypothetical protein [Anaerolineae bacterium]